MYARTHRSKRTMLTVAASGFAMTLVISELRAQDALGTGNALDRNPGVNSGGQNTGRPPDPYAGRNAVVTGEVIGGREFRGRVGYTAPGDFRGATGADDLFRFRANSAWSSPGVVALGGSTYDQLRFGQGLGVFELQRNSAGATPTSVQQAPAPPAFSELAESRLRYDSVALSSLSSARMQTAADPTMLAMARTREGDPVIFSASAARGLTLEVFTPQWEAIGLSEYDQVRAREELAAQPLPGQEGGVRPVPRDPNAPRGLDSAMQKEADTARANRIGATFETRFDDPRSSARQETAVVGEHRVAGEVQTDYGKVLQRIVERYSNAKGSDATIDPGLLEKLQEQYGSVREGLGGQPAGPTTSSGAPTGSATPGPVESSTTPGRPAQPGTGQPTTPTGDPGAPTGQPGAQPKPGETTPPTPEKSDPLADIGKKPEKEPVHKPIDLSEIGEALRHGQKVEKLSSEDQGRFNELIIAAEEQLKKGEYMAAEERFQRALRFSPGNPMAMAGVSNAQIGAGFYLSAALSLRSLFTDHPEMIDVTYIGGLLPDRARVDAAIQTLQARLGAEGATDRASYALLLAHLGRQTENRTLIESGLKTMEEEAADDPLPAVLRAIWLAPPEK